MVNACHYSLLIVHYSFLGNRRMQCVTQLVPTASPIARRRFFMYNKDIEI